MNKIIKGTVLKVEDVGQEDVLVERVTRTGFDVTISSCRGHVPRVLIDAGKYTIVSQPHRDDDAAVVVPVKRIKPQMTKEQRRAAREKGKREHNG